MAGAVTLPITFFTLTGSNSAQDFDLNFNALLTPMNTLLTFSNYAVDSGAANAIVLTYAAPQIVTYSDGLQVQAKIAATNTSSTVNININSIGNAAVVNGDGTALSIGQITAGMIVQFQYSLATNQFQIVGQSRTGSASITTPLTLSAPGSGYTLTVNSIGSAIAVQGAAGVSAQIELAGNGNIPGTSSLSIGQGATGQSQVTVRGSGSLKLSAPAGVNVSTTAGTAFSVSGTGATQAELIDALGNSQISQFNTNNAAGGYIGISRGGTFKQFLGDSSVLAGGTLDDACVRAVGSVALAPAAAIRFLVSIGATTVQGYGPTAGALVDMTPDTGSFTATLTGMTAGTTGAVNWRRSGKIVVLFLVAGINGTSNSVNMTMTGLPAIITPTASAPVCWSSSIQDNGFVLAGTSSISSAGVITFGLGNTSVAANRIVSQQGIFTASGTKGLVVGWTITYTTD